MTIAAIASYTGSLCFATIMVWAALIDLSTMKIRNELTIFLIATYAALAPLTGIGLEHIGWSAAVAMAAFGTMFVFFSLGWIGGGDAKIASIAVLWIGPTYAVDFLIYTALFGGALTVILLQLRSLALPAHWADRPWIIRLCDPRSGVPYGVAIAAGALTIFPHTPWLAVLP